MTAQVLDTIFYRGNEYLLFADPLSQYEPLPDFMAISTANHRGYTAVWAIVGECLFVVSLSGSVVGINRSGLDLVFPNVQAPVLANWFSGELRLLSGRVTSPSDIDLLYEHETVLGVARGLVTTSRSINRNYAPTRSLDPILLQPVDTIDELGPVVTEKLKARAIQRIGDLIQFGEAELMKATGLDVDSILQMTEALACRGLVLGSQVEGWPPENG